MLLQPGLQPEPHQYDDFGPHLCYLESSSPQSLAKILPANPTRESEYLPILFHYEFARNTNWYTTSSSENSEASPLGGTRPRGFLVLDLPAELKCFRVATANFDSQSSLGNCMV
ncbi:hypothetical protein CVT25_006008 [Psilocybe cyanescens]|uniref:Uncharacterized protein n=1 Tax=Psilocybe cyanescens TaxID=93625 RepID=A0A409VME0_PSICY|nr:hypothetical protein CVT25_006008 [Psilocybe cyanescens]